MNTLSHDEGFLHAAEVASAIPLLGALLIVSLPIWLALVLYRKVADKSQHDGK